MTVAFIFGAAYAAVLWLAAQHVARARALPLGGWPLTTILGCGIAAASIDQFFAHDFAVLLSASLIGTIVCATVDARTGLIFDVLSLSMIAVAASLALITGHLADGACASAVVGGALFALHVGTGRRGIGLGDVKLGAALALGYGLQLSIVAIGGAFVIGAGYASVLLGFGRVKRSDAVRFGPFIAAGAAFGLIANVAGYRW